MFIFVVLYSQVEIEYFTRYLHEWGDAKLSRQTFSTGPFAVGATIGFFFHSRQFLSIYFSLSSTSSASMSSASKASLFEYVALSSCITSQRLLYRLHHLNRIYVVFRFQNSYKEFKNNSFDSQSRQLAQKCNFFTGANLEKHT